MVRTNQVIARIGNPLLAQQVRLAEMALADAEREAERNFQMRSATAALQTKAIDSQRMNLEREITELEGQTAFAAEQIGNKQKLFDEGLTVKSNLVAAQEKLVEIRADIARHRTQLSQLQVESFTAQASVENAGAQARERIGELERRVTELREELSHTTSAIAPSEGRVIETKVYPGAMVNAGAPLVTIQPAEGALQALIYVPSKQAKHVVAGMEVHLSPSGTRPEEQGYLLGTVLTVAAYPVSQLAVLRKLENETLANSITGQGPVSEVRVALRRDPAGIGYQWSAHRGQRGTLSGGTLCGARLVIGRQRPLTLVAPLMKEALGLD
jgi:NHLM bacteriocin system secretion protein